MSNLSKYSDFESADGRLHALNCAVLAAKLAKPGAATVLAAEGSLPAAMLGGMMNHRVSSYRAYAESLDGQPIPNRTIHAIHEAAHIERAIVAAGADQVAALVIEPVLCASRGILDIPAAYFLRVRNICDRYRVAMVWDESTLGTGYCGYLFAFERFGVLPEIAIVANQNWNAGITDLATIGVIYHQSLGRSSSTSFPEWLFDGPDARAVRAVETAALKFGRSTLGHHQLVLKYHQIGLMGGLSVGYRDAGKRFNVATQINQKLRRLAGKYGVRVFVNVRTLREESGDQLFFMLPATMTGQSIFQFLKSIRMLLDVVLLDLVNAGHIDQMLQSDDGISAAVIADSLDAEPEKNQFFRMPADLTKAS